MDAKQLQGFRFGTNVHLDIKDEFEDWQEKVRGRTKLNFLLVFFFFFNLCENHFIFVFTGGKKSLPFYT